MADSIVVQLQSDAIDLDQPTANLLRKAKIISSKLGLKELDEWLRSELYGYEVESLDELPSYRIISGEAKFWNPYRGWLPIHFDAKDAHDYFCRVPVVQPISTIEDLLDGASNGGILLYEYPHELKRQLLESIPFGLEPKLHTGRSQLLKIVDIVRNRILEWSLELERAGVLGNGLTFTPIEQRSASTVTQQFYASNIGVIGDVSGSANVKLLQFSNVGDPDIKQLGEVIKQIKGASDLLPAAEKEKIVPLIAALDKELSNEAVNKGKITKILSGIKSVCEGASGNLVAEGIMVLLSRIFG